MLVIGVIVAVAFILWRVIGNAMYRARKFTRNPKWQLIGLVSIAVILSILY